MVKGSINNTAKNLGLLSCHVCSQLSQADQARCPRCKTPLHFRKSQSIQRCWALLITSAFLYVPAMIYPVTTIELLGKENPTTLMGSVIHFMHSGAWPIGLVIFMASVVVPILKVIGLSYLLITVQMKSAKNRVQRTKLYRVVEFVGRWSMIDVFVVSLLVALVQIGVFLNMLAGIGIVAFASVVVLTMLAARCFDPRLIWDE